MSARRVFRTLVLRPSAKINLTLRVGPSRADRFHDVQTLLQSIDLHDSLRLTSHDGPFGLAGPASGIPMDQSNLIWRAADHLWRALGRSGPVHGVQVTIRKNIPAAAGLGGGSADAAAALVGLNKLWHGRLRHLDLMEVAAGLGSDVPFFLHGGTAIALGRGDEIYPVDDIKPLSLLILKPPFGVSTADAYQWLDDDRRQNLISELPSRKFDPGWGMSPLALVNDLEAPVTRRHQEIAVATRSLVRAGALAAAMTGSGSAVFGLFPPGIARSAAKRLRMPGWLVLTSRTLSRRASIRQIAL